MYTISFPSAVYLFKFSNTTFHPVASFAVNFLSVSCPSCTNTNSTFSGLTPALLLSSSHTFVTVISVLSSWTLLGLNVFVIVFPSTTLSYFSSFSVSSSFTVSSITYLISFPFTSYFFNPVNVCVQFSFSVTSFIPANAYAPSSPYTLTCNIILVISYAFAASLSVFSHTFVACFSVFIDV